MKCHYFISATVVSYGRSDRLEFADVFGPGNVECNVYVLHGSVFYLSVYVRIISRVTYISQIFPTYNILRQQNNFL